ncbi:DUF1289 domain-containing protein [Marinomonas sp. 2405UD68-3]|uniref:DUF1289 domain-containing protein n=1 Tax=Marinomonas sp. 2405UD68-3 TaxID=3391835 RepID=UPI0039C9A3ED
MKRQKSPCINTCDFSHYKGWCVGCGRTRQECNKWKSMKPYDKKFLQKERQTRLNLIGKQRAEND